jgi:hypothetical protein
MTTDKTSTPKPATTSAVTAPPAPPTPAQVAIATLADFEQHLRAEAGFRGQPGSQLYDCDRIIRLAERYKKAAEKLSVAR